MFPRYGYGIMVEAKPEDLVQLVNQANTQAITDTSKSKQHATVGC